MNHSGDHSNSIIQQNRQAYSRIAADWQRRQDTDFDHDFHERCRELFLKHLKGRRVLDAGCGLGLDSLAFASCGLEVTAADIVPEFLVEIRSITQEVRPVAMDITAPCFRGESFDGIYLCASFLHIPHDLSGPAISAFERILAPGGILFIGHVSSDRGLSEYQVDDLLIESNPALCFCHPPQELGLILNAAGFELLALEQYQPSKYPSPCAVRNSLTPYQIVAGKNS
jgi:SAM-dependent methyltransferase